MNRLLIFLFIILGLSARAALVSYSALNANQFYGDPTNGVVTLKPGVLLTNPVVNGNISITGTASIGTLHATNEIVDVIETNTIIAGNGINVTNTRGVVITNPASASMFRMDTNSDVFIGSSDNQGVDSGFIHIGTNGLSVFQGGAASVGGSEGDLVLSDGSIGSTFGGQIPPPIQGGGYADLYVDDLTGVLQIGAFGTAEVAGQLGGTLYLEQYDSATNGNGVLDGYVYAGGPGCTPMGRSLHLVPENGGTVFLDADTTVVTNLNVHGVLGVAGELDFSGDMFLSGGLNASGVNILANLDMSGNTINNVGTPGQSSDAATKGYVDGLTITSNKISGQINAGQVFGFGNGSTITNGFNNTFTKTNFLLATFFTNTATRSIQVVGNARCNPTTTGNAIFRLLIDPTGSGTFSITNQSGLEADIIFTTAPHVWSTASGIVPPGGRYEFIDVTGDGLVTMTNSYFQTLQ